MDTTLHKTTPKETRTYINTHTHTHTNTNMTQDTHRHNTTAGTLGVGAGG